MWRIETELPAKENPHKRGLARGLCDKRTGNDKTRRAAKPCNPGGIMGAR